MKLTLVRCEHNETETLGMLLIGSRLFCSTLELPWRKNERGISCIPDGDHAGRRVISPKFGETFELDVPGRSEVIIHAGNTHEDTRGCIILGMRPGTLNGKRAVKYSQIAMKRFRQYTEKADKILLYIRSIYP